MPGAIICFKTFPSSANSKYKNSKTEKEGKASAAQLEGKLGRNIREIKDGIVDLLADIEADIDYPEYEDIEQLTNETLIPLIKDFNTSVFPVRYLKLLINSLEVKKSINFPLSKNKTLSNK